MNLLDFPLFIFFRHSSGNLELNEREIIEDYVKNQLGKQIKPVPGDGHCMVNAFSLGLKEKDGQQSLLTNIAKEFLKNRDRYSDFVDIKEEELEAYVKYKKYNSSLVDVIPYVVANITNTSISILQVQNGQVNTLLISPRNMEPEKVERTIYVYKTGDHYDAILERDEAASGLKIEGKPDIVLCSFLRIHLSGIDSSFWFILRKIVFSPLIASFFISLYGLGNQSII